MTLRTATTRVLYGTLAAIFCGWVTFAAQLSQEDGDRLQRKIDEITRNGAAVPVPAKKTRALENEINSYLAFNARDKIPPALAQPEITLAGNGLLAGRIFVDLDEFKRQRHSQGFLDPLNYLSGKVPVTARGILQSREGKGRLQLETAEIHGLPLPKPILQELVTFFTRAPERPGGFDLDAPFDLPAKTREVLIGRGEAVVVQ